MAPPHCNLHIYTFRLSFLTKHLFHLRPTSKDREENLVAMALAECTVCLIAAIDRLWFHKNVVLFSESQPSSFPPPHQESPPLTTQSLLNSSKHTSQSLQISPQDEISSQESDDLEKEAATDDDDERPARLKLNDLVSAKSSRYHSSSPISATKRSRNHRKLKKSSSCKSLMDLELEEVKGFMDLGFTFRRENLTKRIIHLVPGLQRINGSSEDDEHDDEQQRKEIMRPYLSEAWIMRKSDHSPLLDLRIPKVSTAADMKKQLKYWAQTVASAIHQES